MSANTGVEYSLAEIELNDGSKKNIVSTSSMEGSDFSFIYYFNDTYANDIINIPVSLNHVHNHPSGVALPSGMGNKDTGDIGFANEMASKFRKGANSSVYSAKDKIYVPYNGKSTVLEIICAYLTLKKK